MSTAVVQVVRFADAHESHFQHANNYMSRDILQRGLLMMITNRVFTLPNAQIWVVLSCMEIICWCSGIAFSSCQTLRYGKCRNAGGLIYWCSGFTFSGIDLSSYQKFRYGSAAVQAGRYADVQESLLPADKCSDMGSVNVHLCQFGGALESGFQAAKRSDITRSNVKGGHFSENSFSE